MSKSSPDTSWIADVMAKLEHDLRNPLTAVMGFADLLGMSDLDEAQRQHLNRIHQAAEQLLQVLETMEERAVAPQRTVVYLEDDAGNVGLIGGILVHRPGVRLISAADAATGLSIVRKEMPDLVLLDLGLPDRNGADVLTDLKADPTTADIPVVVISASADRREDVLAAGAEAYLSKPLEIVEFLEIVDRFAAADSTG
ncbi:MAG TPA: response regulator [Acidimicrobiales bacterium]|nr:response regulator [Acidimicrobiales bacterium]